MYDCRAIGFPTPHSEVVLLKAVTQKFNDPFKPSLMTFTHSNRDRKVTIRFEQQEYQIIYEMFSKTTCRKLSEYLRKLALGKPVTVITRNGSLDALMEELILIRAEFNAVGHNFNQAVKKLHCLTQIPEFRVWLQMYNGTRESLLTQTEMINRRIAQISDQWLQE